MPKPPPAPEQDPDSMVAALLRALGFEDDTESAAGEGQDRAPVGAGQDVPEDVTQARQRATRGAADQWIGTPYHLGGNDQKNVDCSGLVNALLRGFGANVPGRPSTGTYRSQLATPIPWESIQPGDVLISPANRADPVSGEHMALYVGGGQMVEATGPEGAPARYSSVTNRNLQPYRMREPVPGLQQVTLMAAQDSGASAGQAGGQQSPAQASTTPIDTSSNESFIATAYPYLARVERTLGIPAAAMAGIAINEGVAVPGNFAHDHGAVFGVKSTGQDANGNDRDTGLPVAHTDAAWEVVNGRNTTQPANFIQFPNAPASILGFVDFLQRNPRYAPALAAAARGTTPREFTQLLSDAGYATDPNWTRKVLQGAQQLEQMVAQGRVIQPSDAGTPGQQNAGGQPNLVQQAFDQAAPVIQQLLSQVQGAAGAAGERVASLGATPAYAAGPPAAGPPPGPTPQVQQPPTSPEEFNQRLDTMLAPGEQAVGDVAQAAGGVAQAAAAPFGQSFANIGRPTAAQQAAAAQHPPPAPAGPAAPGTPFANAMEQAHRAAASQAAPPATQPAASMAQTQAPPAAPGQAPLPGGLGTNAPEAGAPTYGPPVPARAGGPADTATHHWNPNIQAWEPKTPPMDFGAAGGHFRVVPGQETRDPETGALAPNPPNTPLEYLPNQPGYYDTPQGRMFFDSSTQQWHQPTGQAAQTQVAPVDLAPGLRFTPSAPNSSSGRLTWTDPNTGAVSTAPYNLGDPMPPGLGQPSSALTPAQQATQQSSQASLAQTAASEAARLAESIRSTDLSNANERTRIQNQADQFAANMAQHQADQAAGQFPQAVGPNLYGVPPGSPPGTPPQNLGPVGQTPGQEATTAYTQAQTQALTAEGTLPHVVGNRRYDPVTNPDTGVTTYQDAGAVPMSSYEQANIDQQTAVEAEKQREFGTLSAEQQAVQQQNQASLAQNESQFQQNLQEKQAESARPYSQMTKAEQAQNAIQQQELGLKQQTLGFQETESANKLQPLPRGGIARVNPYTGQIEMVNAPEPEDIRMVGSQILIPGGRQVSMLGQQISGGPNPYAGVPSGQGAPFSYPGGSGGGGQSFGAGGWGGGGMSGGMGGSPAWQPPQQQRQGWMGSGY